MKIAVCLYGQAGGTVKTDKGIKDISPADSYNNYKDVLFKDLDVDFFIHSWSEDYKDELLELYEPKKYIIEGQRDFSGYSLKDYSLDHINTYKSIFTSTMADKNGVILDLNNDVKNFLTEQYIFNTHSRWFSTSRSIGLMVEYAKSKNIEYDWVLQLRMDLYFRESFPFRSLNPSSFYACPRFSVDKDFAVNDIWFLSNQKNAVFFSKIYENIFDYSIWPHSAAKQHIDSFGASIDFYPEVRHGRKNYWLKRELLIQENIQEITFYKRLAQSVLQRMLNYTHSFEGLLRKVISKLS